MWTALHEQQTNDAVVKSDLKQVKHFIICVRTKYKAIMASFVAGGKWLRDEMRSARNDSEKNQRGFEGVVDTYSFNEVTILDQTSQLPTSVSYLVCTCLCRRPVYSSTVDAAAAADFQVVPFGRR